MTKLPAEGARGQLWSVRVPVVFDVNARSWADAKALVEKAITGSVAAAHPAESAPEGIRGWAHQESAYPAKDVPDSVHQTFLSDLTTVEVLRALVDGESHRDPAARTLTDEELVQLQVTLASADRFVELETPGVPGEPLFAGHASEAVGEVPEGLYDARDFMGRSVQLLVGPSRFGQSGQAAASLPIGQIDSRALSDIASLLQHFDRMQQPSAVLERVSAVVQRTGHSGLRSGELLAARAAAARPAPVMVGVVDWSDDPEVEPTIRVGTRSAPFVRALAQEVFEELSSSDAYAGATEFLSTHRRPQEWRTPEDVDAWLDALREATPHPRVTVTQIPLNEAASVGHDVGQLISAALQRREEDLRPPTSAPHAPTSRGPELGL
ncbi:hypothetical protein ACTJI8_10100 [Microbacterium sp. 22303]|uniref:hypothetical protein n=1 Tax=Microbacterium sp. 22303 TaxID=3453905 RepID=UPI003F841C21